MAPKTRCVNATSSAAYEKRRSAVKLVIVSDVRVHAAPGHHKHGGEGQRGDDCPRDFHATSRCRPHDGAKNRKMSNGTRTCGSPEEGTRDERRKKGMDTH